MSIKGNSKTVFLANLNATRPKVEHFLTADRTLADNDERLVSNIWHLELVKLGMDPNKITAAQLLKIYSEGKLTAADVITRARRKVEEDLPQLRGDTYEERQGLKKPVADHINDPVEEKPKKGTGPNRPSI